MDNELSCPVCGEAFGQGKHKPRMINCGHTQCTSCLTTILRGADQNCPECRASIFYQTVDDIPINFVVVRMVSKGENLGFGILQNIKDKLALRQSDLKGAISNAQSKIAFHENQVTQYSNLISKYEKQSSQLEEWLLTFKMIESKLKSASSTVKLAEAAKEVGESFQIIGQCLEEDLDLEAVKAEAIDLPKTDCDIQSMNLVFNDANRFYAQFEEGDSIRWARVTLHGSKIHLHVLQTASPPASAIILKYEEIRKTISPENCMSFFEICWDDHSQGFVYFQMSNSPLTQSFIKLCTGEGGPSYVDTCFFSAHNVGCPGERIQGGDYVNNTGEYNEFDENVFKEILADVPITAGLLANYGTQFKIFLSDWPNRTDCLCHGKVVQGLAILREAARHNPINDVTIKSCGLVVPNP